MSIPLSEASWQTACNQLSISTSVSWKPLLHPVSTARVVNLTSLLRDFNLRTINDSQVEATSAIPICLVYVLSISVGTNDVILRVTDPTEVVLTAVMTREALNDHPELHVGATCLLRQISMFSIPGQTTNLKALMIKPRNILRVFAGKR
jgi:Homologous recombination OB-fold protein